MKTELRINEIFNSLQGEGRASGQPALFIRLSGCTLDCSFCDTKYHNNHHELTKKEIGLLKNHKTWIFTGGEPLMQQEGIWELCQEFSPFKVEFETNGTLQIKEPIVNCHAWRFNISPKEKRFQPKNFDPTPHILEQDIKNKVIKFVYSDIKSKKFISDTIKKYKLNDKDIWIMPEGKSKKELDSKKQEVWNYCVKHNYNMSPRLQVDIWDIKRGI